MTLTQTPVTTRAVLLVLVQSLALGVLTVVLTRISGTEWGWSLGTAAAVVVVSFGSTLLRRRHA